MCLNNVITTHGRENKYPCKNYLNNNNYKNVNDYFFPPISQAYYKVDIVIFILPKIS